MEQKQIKETKKAEQTSKRRTHINKVQFTCSPQWSAICQTVFPKSQSKCKTAFQSQEDEAAEREKVFMVLLLLGLLGKTVELGMRAQDLQWVWDLQCHKWFFFPSHTQTLWKPPMVFLSWHEDKPQPPLLHTSGSLPVDRDQELKMYKVSPLIFTYEWEKEQFTIYLLNKKANRQMSVN